MVQPLRTRSPLPAASMVVALVALVALVVAMGAVAYAVLVPASAMTDEGAGTRAPRPQAAPAAGVADAVALSHPARRVEQRTATGSFAHTVFFDGAKHWVVADGVATYLTWTVTRAADYVVTSDALAMASGNSGPECRIYRNGHVDHALTSHGVTSNSAPRTTMSRTAVMPDVHVGDVVEMRCFNPTTTSTTFRFLNLTLVAVDHGTIHGH